MKNSQSQLLSVVLLLILVLGGIFFVNPLRESVAEMKVDRDDSVSRLAQSQLSLESMKLLAEEVSAESAKADLLDAVPVGNAQDELILEMESIAKKAGFDLNAVNFTEGSDAEYGQKVIVAANLAGSYDDLVEFLQRVENADRLMTVDSMTVQLTSTDSVVFNVSLSAYHQ